MWEPADTTGHNSQLSFYEYPSHKPFINSTHQPLRPSYTLSATAALPESNRDQLLTSLQSLTLKIRTLEAERERAETKFDQITSAVRRPPVRPSGVDDQLEEAEQRFNHLKRQHEKMRQLMEENKPQRKSRKKRSGKHNRSFDTTTTGTTANTEGRHYHLDMTTVPFILGASTSPSHNVKSNVQNVIALLKNHNHQLCLSSKEYEQLIHPHLKGDLSPHTLLYLDHFHRSSTRPSSASPVRSTRRPPTASTDRPYSASRRPQSAIASESQQLSRIRRLRQEFTTLAQEHARLHSTRSHERDLHAINRRMEDILNELERLQKHLRATMRRTLPTKDNVEFEKNETPLETLRRTRLIQNILKDTTSKQQQQHRGGRSNRARPYSNE